MSYTRDDFYDMTLVEIISQIRLHKKMNEEQNSKSNKPSKNETVTKTRTEKIRYERVY